MCIWKGTRISSSEEVREGCMEEETHQQKD